MKFEKTGKRNEPERSDHKGNLLQLDLKAETESLEGVGKGAAGTAQFAGHAHNGGFSCMNFRMGVGHVAGIQLVGPPDMLAPASGGGHTFARPFDQVLPLELGKRGHNGIDQFPRRRRSIHVKRDNLEFNTALAEFFTFQEGVHRGAKRAI